MPTPLLVQSLALLSAPLAGAAGLLGLRLRRSAGVEESRESGLRQQLAELQSRCEELERLAARDPLTGVWNYRHLQTTLEREIARCDEPHPNDPSSSGPSADCRRPSVRQSDQRQPPERQSGAAGASRPLALVLLEIDGFDALNAEHGRSRGDVMLRELAQRLSVEIRRTDTLGRYGGTEFLVVLPDTGADGAVRVAERLCWSVRRHRLLDWAPGPWEDGRTPRQGNGLTAAAGVAVLPVDGTHAAPLLRAADRALAAAKRQALHGLHGNLSACAGSEPPALTGRAARNVAVVAVADEVRSHLINLAHSQGGHLPQ
ncbi:diguanylate cyclase (GGDEF)-like protein [Kitasatospora sp. MAA4]|uniref:GGDEF domain-containing protein n=1 Tax=Kitasatospora sp. MAA4 TaxID=3035093 RepID=UPI002476DA1D|nr:GGDEF domain-containing protein [Kitasatospora sp. MAA4]MDH6134071.1 diguanylate cyclase (GGDEF)-like protein [Kitasatospora sp. MAA4]